MARQTQNTSDIRSQFLFAQGWNSLFTLAVAIETMRIEAIVKFLRFESSLAPSAPSSWTSSSDLAIGASKSEVTMSFHLAIGIKKWSQYEKRVRSGSLANLGTCLHLYPDEMTALSATFM